MKLVQKDGLMTVERDDDPEPPPPPLPEYVDEEDPECAPAEPQIPLIVPAWSTEISDLRMRLEDPLYIREDLWKVW